MFLLKNLAKVKKSELQRGMRMLVRYRREKKLPRSNLLMDFLIKCPCPTQKSTRGDAYFYRVIFDNSGQQFPSGRLLCISSH